MEKYVDTSAIIQVIGCIYNNPQLLSMEDKYSFKEIDFPDKFHRILFGSIYNLYSLGAKEINTNTVEDYLSQRPQYLAIYQANNGADFLTKVSLNAQQSSFDYYYTRMKKMSLLRMYSNIGMDLSWLYDTNNILDAKKKQAQEDWLDSTSVEEIADIIDKRISDIRAKYVEDSENGIITKAGDGIFDLLKRLEDSPEIGYPLYGPLINSITLGARLKKFYLRSAPTGTGKTKSMVADACYIACDEIYDSNKRQWVKNNTKEPTLFISTEQEVDEIQTMMLAFLADVNEDHIIKNTYLPGELERVVYAGKVLNNCPIYIQTLSNFSLSDIENVIKTSIRNFNITYVFLDYIHSSLKILSEISSHTRVSNLREDNILFMISTKLKDICNEYNVFIMSATQLNGDYRTAKRFDQNLLRGAKSIGDKIDIGMIMLEVNEEDLIALKDVIIQGGFEMPAIKISVYKNRRNRYKDILLWCKANRGTCRIEPMFATNYQYELVSIEDLQINIRSEEKKN